MNKARFLLTMIGGLAAMVAGTQDHYRADYQTPARKTRGRKRKNSYGANLLRHFDSVGINWSSKGNRK